MQRVCLAFAFVLAALAFAACDSGEACIIDSDCADFTHVCIERRCVPAGTTADAGPRDAGRERDASPAPDAGRDAGPAPGDDAGTDGGATDGGAPSCGDPTGAWTITEVASCAGATTGHTVTITAGAAACEFIAAPDDPSAPAIEGTFTLDAAGSIAGTLNPGGAGLVECTGTFGDSTLTFVCGECTVTLGR